MHTIGIDLGTTYSCVYSRTRDSEVLIRAADGADLTPSVLHFDVGGSVLVGAEAKARLRDDPDNVVVGIKRYMGKDFPLQFGDRILTPEAISALILKRLAKDAADALTCSVAELKAVITVPAYFGVAEKEATYTAARIAGLDCLELLAEPVAAAYAYGAHKDSSTTSLVFDLGGGTFDVAVVGIDRGTPRIWAVDGETQLGGLDWDARLTDLLWEQIEQQADDSDDLRDDEEFVGELSGTAEQVKRQLSQSVSAPKAIRRGRQKFAFSVSRDAFEVATRDLVLQCGQSVDRVVTAARELGAPQIGRVLLVGGSTRMPMIRDYLAQSLNVPVEINDPDKAVARGAAVLAEQLGQPASTHLLSQVARITPVLPRSIGIYIHSSHEPWRPDPYVRSALTANSPLPIVNHEVSVATILDKQERARIRLYEQGGAIASERPEDNRLIFDGEVSEIPQDRGGSEIKLLISVGMDGRITVVARSWRNKPLPMECFIEGVLDDDEVARQTQTVAGLMLVD
ncbi:molecular chaperone [Mycolicibacterium conceptionense]|uniref:Hsp70 family protein n=1 Tax=Mycolicibacterium conceptionense TaxID=451644 RepID=UPI0007EC5E14|nr:Hsp70 family protein [Mycolicibacterium conceptionense]OBJ98315.1 molecular chaperone [Mycolicibacterium conceptionense]OMB86006.1 molecular chaperone [Mycolicibacterium conceptionense]OMB99986.1 molecular chaperone [Mycolicibacterium conceptionense]